MADKYVGLDVHKATTSYCVRDAAGKVKAEGVVDTSCLAQSEDETSEASENALQPLTVFFRVARDLLIRREPDAGM